LKFFSRAILFVEGPTDVNVFPILFNKLGFNLKKLGIGIIPLIGSPKANYHLKLWKEIAGSVKTITKNVSLPIFMILDLNAKNIAERAIAEGLVSKSNCFVLSMGDIEDYYPLDIVMEVIEQLCGKKPTKSELVGKKVVAINRFLKKNKYYDDWKITLGTKVASLIESIDIPLEIQEIIQKIIKVSN
jgi:predicted ATP-dependent endonuclease of OLD family